VSCETEKGWGSGYGTVPWGFLPDDIFNVQKIYPIRENVIRILFSNPPNFTGVLDSKDASNPNNYRVYPVAGTVGYDGSPSRNVNVAGVEQPKFIPDSSSMVDLLLDRPLSPFPARYNVIVGSLFSYKFIPIDVCDKSREILGLYRGLQPQIADQFTPTRDIANPNTLSAMTGLAVINEDQLGIIPIGSDGDYAFDEGLTNLRKRIYRRLMTNPGAFIFMPTYGVGLPRYAKRLNLASTRTIIVATAQSQISQEPEIQRCVVQMTNDPAKPNLFYLNVIAKTALSAQSVKFTFPFQVGNPGLVNGRSS